MQHSLHRTAWTGRVFTMDGYELKSALTANCTLSSLQTTNTAGKLYNHSFVRVLAELAEFFPAASRKKILGGFSAKP